MAKEDKNSEIIEHGDLVFFYRPKIDAKEVKDVQDVQRFYMVTAPEKDGKATANKQVYRLFLIGQKQMPEIIAGKTNSKEMNWALNIFTTTNPEDLCKELLPAEYTPETRDTRRVGGAGTSWGRKILSSHSFYKGLKEISDVVRRRAAETDGSITPTSDDGNRPT